MTNFKINKNINIDYKVNSIIEQLLKVINKNEINFSIPAPQLVWKKIFNLFKIFIVIIFK